jgi:aspartate/tyrosine/aromatic aminotransferase
LHVVLKEAGPAQAVSGQLGRIVRAMYSNPPSYGAAIVKTVINDEALYEVLNINNFD